MLYQKFQVAKMRKAFLAELVKQARNNPDIFLITGDLGYGVLEEFQERYPDQFLNSGVNEQTMMGLAAGLASTGRRVFVYSIGNFPTLRCLEQIRNDVCLMNNPVTIVSVGAGYAYGAQGYSHHALEDVAALRSLPNLEVLVPSSELETRLLTEYVCTNKNPSYLRLGKELPGEDPEFDGKIEVGKVRIIKNGESGTILFNGSLHEIVRKADMLLQGKGFNLTVATVPFVSAIDIEFLGKAAAMGPIITVEEHTVKGGLGAAVLEAAAKGHINSKIGLVGSQQSDLTRIGSQSYLREAHGISSTAIISEFEALLG